MNTLTCRRIFLHLPSERSRVVALLEECGLRLDPVELYLGVFDADERLVGGAGLQGDVIKCVAVSSEARDMGVTNLLITELRREAAERGVQHLMLFTKPANEALFASLAFHIVGRSPQAVLMESKRGGVGEYASTLKALARPGRCGVVVMNCNPLTRGHEYLLRTAAGRLDTLYVIPVAEDGSEYSLAERTAMLTDVCDSIPGAVLCPGSRYTISQATFPSYFLKRVEDATDTQILLDLDIFANHIAPALGATVRVVGSEPCDPLTARYNLLMHSVLSQHDIDVIEVPRMEMDGVPVSASRVRTLLKDGQAEDALALLPSSSVPVVLAHEARRAMMAELLLTPKPGLVDRHDNGAHTDMDIPMMQASAATVAGVLTHVAEAAAQGLSVSHLQEICLRGEREMLECTGGVNTHKGALFSMALMIAAFVRLYGSGTNVAPQILSGAIASLAGDLPDADDTHGACVRRRYGIPGALDYARSGYARLFTHWLPMLRRGGDFALHRLLLTIMSELEDTNVYYRGGSEGAAYVKRRARELRSDFSLRALAAANDEFVARNLSPGGAADMLALTLLADTLCGGRLSL